MEPVVPNSKKGALIFIAFLVVSFYWMFTCTGPYRYLAELQRKWWGSYSPKLTLMVIVLALMGAMALIRQILKGTEQPAPSSVTPLPPKSTPQPIGSGSVSRFVLSAVVLFPFAFGAYAYSNGMRAGNLQQLTANDFLSGNLRSRIVYAELRSHVNRENVVSKSHYLYIPVTEDGNIHGPLHLFIGVNEANVESTLRREADGSFTVRGIADQGIAGDVKYVFEKNGVTVGDPCWILHAGRDPSSDKKFALIMAGVGVLFAGFMFGKENYQKKKELAPRPLRTSV